MPHPLIRSVARNLSTGRLTQPFVMISQAEPRTSGPRVAENARMSTRQPAEDPLDRAADRIWDEIAALLERGQPDLARIARLRDRALCLRHLARREERERAILEALHDEDI